ncbi:MAG: flavin-dependent oxidoreductase [Pigmentiphaga sp.]|nr:flavin-dependent oxidoreductase [Pigmentiphaga sp.]
MKIAIIGGGIGGLTTALMLHQRGLRCEVYEAVPDVKEIGVGITLLPHAMRELAALGLQDALERDGIENLESVFYNNFGQFIYKEPRGRHAGYDVPELGMHRGKLHRILYDAAKERLGADKIHTGYRASRVEQTGDQVTVHFDAVAGNPAPAPVKADLVLACDGVNSSIRRQFYPDESVAFAGINTWRGVTRHAPILTGKSYIRIGSIETGKLVVYPIIDGNGEQLINWTAEIRQPGKSMNDWNKTGKLEDFLPIYEDWKFDWLDVPTLMKNSDVIFEYPMVDKDPIDRWTFGRTTFLGDAAHPMYPRGSNGSAQAILDAKCITDILARPDTPNRVEAALQEYEDIRRPATANVVLTNRSVPPDFIIMKVDELSGGKPFDNIDDLISQEELREISDNYKKVAGFSK